MRTLLDLADHLGLSGRMAVWLLVLRLALSCLRVAIALLRDALALRNEWLLSVALRQFDDGDDERFRRRRP